ncbi:MAG TPA: TetR/AcrR family transcriptional regulator [Solirubrobacter sp.]|nr:TetR/AcrR family transcriptional regulator [Solirubrobacter sp.]
MPRTSSPNRRRRGEGLPDEMLQRAAEVFARKGYDGASLQDLAEAIGMQKGSLYHWIETKEDLLVAVIERAHEATLASNVRWRDVEDPVEALHVFVADHARVAIEHQLATRVYLQDFESISAARRRDVLRSRDSYEAELRGLLERGQATGRLRDGVDVRLSAFAILGMVNWLAIWYRADGDLRPDDIVRELAAMAVAGVVA